MQLFII